MAIVWVLLEPGCSLYISVPKGGYSGKAANESADGKQRSGLYERTNRFQ